MHQALELAAEFAFHRHHKAPVADGDDLLLQHLLIAGGADDLFQAGADGSLSALDFAPDGGQVRAGGIGQLLLSEDGPVDVVLQIAEGRQALEQIVQAGRLFPLAAETGQIAHRPQHRGHRQ